MIAKEGIPFILWAAGSLIVFIIVPKAALITAAVLLLLLFLWFFRDPERTIPPYENIAVAPADGKVVEIAEDYFDGVKYTRVSIFMNVFNVHVNRIPVNGEIESVVHKDGGYLPADRPDAPLKNEQNIITVNTIYGKMIVKQVAGLVARRCVCFFKAGEKLAIGDRLGLIKFSSRVDTFFPEGFDIVVNNEEKTIAGETIIAKYQGQK